MTISAISVSEERWPLARILVLILAGAFAGLMVDIRVEHVDAVRDHSIAWLPIIYSGFMIVACFGAFIFWSKIARRIMMGLFVVAFAIGNLGFYLHNHGEIRKVIRTSVDAWTDSGMEHTDEPPQVAPLAFAGLGLLGGLTTLGRFNS